MTESLKFTSPAPAPVSGVLVCASRKADAENDLRLARAIDVELDGRGTEQHVNIKVGTLRVLADAVMSLAKQKVSLEAALVERREDLALVDGQLNEWRMHTRHILDTYFATYPTSNANDLNLRLIMKEAIQSAHNKNKQLNKYYDAMRNSADASDKLRKAAERERDDVINLNRNAEEEIQHLQKRNEHLDQTVVDLVRQRDKNGQQANQLANELVEKRKEISRLLEIIDRLHAEIAEKRDIIGAVTLRCTALTNDAKAMSKNNSELAARLANAGLEIGL